LLLLHANRWTAASLKLSDGIGESTKSYLVFANIRTAAEKVIAYANETSRDSIHIRLETFSSLESAIRAAVFLLRSARCRFRFATGERGR
jgi:Lhr-like helicase